MANINQRFISSLRRKGLTVRTRRQWGNKSPVYQIRRKTKPHNAFPSDTVVQHITVTHDYLDVKKSMRLLHTIGMQRFGSGVSYNIAISMKTGRIGIGMPLDAKGTHTVNYKAVPGFSYDQNKVALAIAFIGQPGDKLDERAIHSCSEVIKSLMEVGALTRGHDYVPHSIFAAKDCPTDEVRNHMEEIDSNYEPNLFH